MATEPKQTRAATTALLYLTAGALIDVWTVIYYVYLWRHGGSDTGFLICHGCFFSGLVLLGIGLAIGRIGRSAKHTEVGPQSNTSGSVPYPSVPAMPPQTNGVVQQAVPVMTVQAVPVAAPPMAKPPMQSARF